MPPTTAMEISGSGGREKVKEILLEHGSGGESSARLISELFLEAFSNPSLDRLEDATPFDGAGSMAITTDSYTVKPIFFSGGDIGKLSVCGTCNDLAVMGARPLHLTCGFIIEEGFTLKDLGTIVTSMKEELAKNGARIIAGDTKVVPRGAADGIFINTTGVGQIMAPGISASAIREGDAILVSHSVGEHGAHIFIAREEINIRSPLRSDCASIWPLVKLLIDSGIPLRAMRDATRGGLSAVLNEWAQKSDICISVNEAAIPVTREVRGVCELLGFEAYHLACEGTFVLAVPEHAAAGALEIMKSHELGRSAAVIGSAGGGVPRKVILNTSIGTRRILEMPAGFLLPRIC